MGIFDDLIPAAETKAPAGMFDDLIPEKTAADAPLKITVRPQVATFESRFSAVEPQAPAPSRFTQMATDFQNIGAAASQRTTPDVSAHANNLISADVYENDSGEVMFRDPATGQVVPTDKNKHVAIRDPSDNKVKIFARSPDTDESGLESFSRIMMTGMGAGSPTRRPAIPTPRAADVQPKASDIFATSKPFYRAFKTEAGGIDVPAETAAGISGRIKGALEGANFIQELAPPVYAALSRLESGSPMTLDVLQNIKRVVGRSFQSPDKNVRDAASVASREISRIISEVSSTAGQNLKTADAIHSTARSVQDLQRKADVADLRAGRAGYGGNAVNSMRQVLSPIVQRAVEGRVTGFQPAEIQAMREIVEGTTATNTLRTVGQLSPSKGAIQTVGAGGAVLAAGPVGLIIPALGGASNKLAAILTSKQIDRLKELVAKRSPAYAQAVERAVQRYEKAQSELVNNPSPAKLQAYVSASRSLSSGLTRDGIAITSGDLMRSIQGPVRSAAEDEQPEPERVLDQ